MEIQLAKDIVNWAKKTSKKERLLFHFYRSETIGYFNENIQAFQKEEVPFWLFRALPGYGRRMNQPPTKTPSINFYLFDNEFESAFMQTARESEPNLHNFIVLSYDRLLKNPPKKMLQLKYVTVGFPPEDILIDEYWQWDARGARNALGNFKETQIVRLATVRDGNEAGVDVIVSFDKILALGTDIPQNSKIISSRKMDFSIEFFS